MMQAQQIQLLNDSPFMRACRRQSVPYTPVWLMRQAGRYMAEYREVRAKVSFLELCKSPDLASEVTVFAAKKLGVDAAIIFADILLILEPLGLNVEFTAGDGPVILNPVKSAEDIVRLREMESADALDFVLEAIKTCRSELPSNMPLIGFAGAPFTLASYIIEGGGSRNYVDTKTLMCSDSGAWHELMAVLSRALTIYLNAQVAAGAQALQLFDSWVGCLKPDDYRQFVLPYVKRILQGIDPEVPVIYFGTNTTTLLPLVMEASPTVIGIDWRISMADARQLFRNDFAVQGNLDPVELFAPRERLIASASQILEEAGRAPGHIFNLGHGILPRTPVDNVRALVDSVHELSQH